MSPNQYIGSDMPPWRRSEYYSALNGTNTNTNYSSNGGGHPEMQGSGSLPINSWHQTPAAPTVTPGGHSSSDYPYANSVSYVNYNSQFFPYGTTNAENFETPWARSVPPASPAPGGVNASSCIPQQHLYNCFAYALDRGNGQYTQLVPADCLPALLGFPSLQNPAGLIILNPPIGPAPSHPAAPLRNPNGANFTTAAAAATAAHPVIGTGRPHPFSSSPSSSRSPVNHNNGSDALQSTIDHIVATLPHATAPAPTSLTTAATKKRDKIYCDKWLHEGVCAFAQQGCRYKHEMPLDKATQHAVGLFNGLPKWFREKRNSDINGEGVELLDARAAPTMAMAMAMVGSSVRGLASPRGGSGGGGRSALVNGGSWRGHRGGGASGDGVQHFLSQSSTALAAATAEGNSREQSPRSKGKGSRTG